MLMAVSSSCTILICTDLDVSILYKKYKTDVCFASCLAQDETVVFTAHQEWNLQAILKDYEVQYMNIVRHSFRKAVYLPVYFYRVFRATEYPSNNVSEQQKLPHTQHTVWMPAFLTSIKHDKISTGIKWSNRQSELPAKCEGYPHLWLSLASLGAHGSEALHTLIQRDMGKPLHSVHCVSWQSIVNPDWFPQGHLLLSELSASLYTQLKVIFV